MPSPAPISLMMQVGRNRSASLPIISPRNPSIKRVSAPSPTHYEQQSPLKLSRRASIDVPVHTKSSPGAIKAPTKKVCHLYYLEMAFCIIVTNTWALFLLLVLTFMLIFHRPPLSMKLSNTMIIRSRLKGNASSLSVISLLHSPSLPPLAAFWEKKYPLSHHNLKQSN
jgi:hypothetical protein